MLALAALVLAALPSAPPAQPFGPPAICNPLRIGRADSLPWRGFNKLNGYVESFEISALADRTAEILASSDDSIVHMETIRRAALYLNSKPSSWHPSSSNADRKKSLRALQGRLRAALSESIDKRKSGRPDPQREALASFDIAYLRGALGQLGLDADGDFEEPLERALELAPKDTGMLLGAALLHFRSDEQWSYLDRAIRLTEDDDGDLRWNIVSTAGHIHGIEEFKELAERARKESGADS